MVTFGGEGVVNTFVFGSALLTLLLEGGYFRIPKCVCNTELFEENLILLLRSSSLTVAKFLRLSLITHSHPVLEKCSLVYISDTYFTCI